MSARLADAQRPQPFWFQKTPTRSPTFRSVTPAPTSTISPAGSWPATNGGFKGEHAVMHVHIPVPHCPSCTRTRLARGAGGTPQGLSNLPRALVLGDHGGSHEILRRARGVSRDKNGSPPLERAMPADCLPCLILRSAVGCPTCDPAIRRTLWRFQAVVEPASAVMVCPPTRAYERRNGVRIRWGPRRNGC